MGYNPYVCIVCGDVEDNGWFTGSDGDYYWDRCKKIRQQLNLTETYDDFDMTEDVCDKCYDPQNIKRMQKAIARKERIQRKKDHPHLKRTKAERCAYWEAHCKNPKEISHNPTQ